MTTTLSLNNLSFSIEGKTILNGLTFEATGGRLGVVGRNGSGKSTLARLLAGLVTPNSGSLLINDIDYGRDRKRALSDIGIIFQNPDHQIIFPTVEEEIAFGLMQQGNAKKKAADLTLETLARFGKSHWAEVSTSALSQGQKHLLCLMSVIAMAPKLIILDEPFTGLDIPTKAQLKRYLDRYVGDLIHITHDPADLEEYDQTIWLEDGALAGLGESLRVLGDYVTAMRKLGGQDDISNLAG